MLQSIPSFMCLQNPKFPQKILYVVPYLYAGLSFQRLQECYRRLSQIQRFISKWWISLIFSLFGIRQDSRLNMFRVVAVWLKSVLSDFPTVDQNRQRNIGTSPFERHLLFMYYYSRRHVFWWPTAHQLRVTPANIIYSCNWIIMVALFTMHWDVMAIVMSLTPRSSGAVVFCKKAK